MKARVKWVEEFTFLAESASGHQILLDGNAGDKSPSPMEVILLSLGGCSSIEVVSLLQEARCHVSNCETELSAQRHKNLPKTFSHIHIHFIVTGNNLPKNTVERAVMLSTEKYCCVSLMLEKAVKITHSFVIKEAA